MLRKVRVQFTEHGEQKNVVAYFHTWMTVSQDHIPCAVVELQDGTVRTILIDAVQFINIPDYDQG